MTSKDFKVGDRVAFDWGGSRFRGTVVERDPSHQILPGCGWYYIRTDGDTFPFPYKVDANRDNLRRLAKKPKEKSVGVTRGQLKQALWANSYIRSMNLEKFHDFYTELCKKLELE